MKPIVLLLFLCLGFSTGGCSTQSRQERAYAKYIRQSSAARQKQQSKIRTKKQEMPPMPMPSEPVESISTGPEAMPPEG